MRPNLDRRFFGYGVVFKFFFFLLCKIVLYVLRTDKKKNYFNTANRTKEWRTPRRVSDVYTVCHQYDDNAVGGRSGDGGWT